MFGAFIQREKKIYKEVGITLALFLNKIVIGGILLLVLSSFYKKTAYIILSILAIDMVVSKMYQKETRYFGLAILTTNFTFSPKIVLTLLLITALYYVVTNAGNFFRIIKRLLKKAFHGIHDVWSALLEDTEDKKQDIEKTKSKKASFGIISSKLVTKPGCNIVEKALAWNISISGVDLKVSKALFYYFIDKTSQVMLITDQGTHIQMNFKNYVCLADIKEFIEHSSEHLDKFNVF